MNCLSVADLQLCSLYADCSVLCYVVCAIYCVREPASIRSLYYYCILLSYHITATTTCNTCFSSTLKLYSHRRCCVVIVDCVCLDYACILYLYKNFLYCFNGLWGVEEIVLLT